VRPERRPAAGEDLLRHVAALYPEAIDSGSKTPSKDVEDQLREACVPLSIKAAGCSSGNGYAEPANAATYDRAGETSDEATVSADR
jgi:transposase InsO family protein